MSLNPTFLSIWFRNSDVYENIRLAIRINTRAYIFFYIQFVGICWPSLCTYSIDIFLSSIIYHSNCFYILLLPAIYKCMSLTYCKRKKKWEKELTHRQRHTTVMAMAMALAGEHHRHGPSAIYGHGSHSYSKAPFFFVCGSWMYFFFWWICESVCVWVRASTPR